MMLQTDNSWDKIRGFGIVGEYDHKKHFINIQHIKEKLLRLAVKWCDDYASDVIYLVSNFEERFLKNNITEVDIYFRDMGVNWANNNGKGDEIPKLYRGMAKLVFEKESESMVLYWRMGNC